MVKRWREEWRKHGSDFGGCHCGNGMGTMRKHRPHESHPASTCRVCAYEQYLGLMERRRERRAAHGVINEQLKEMVDGQEESLPQDCASEEGE